MTIGPLHKVALAKEVLIQDLEGKSAVVYVPNQEYFEQNEVGTHMLWVLTESESITAAYHTLLEEYEVDAQQLQQDLLNHLQKLVQHKLVEITAP